MEHDSEQSSTNSPAIDLLSLMRQNASEEVTPDQSEVQRLSSSILPANEAASATAASTDSCSNSETTRLPVCC